MGRLNYTGRKISGVKAGQIVSKDLRKRIPPGSASKAAARDSHMELDLSGKQLTDEGFALFIDDLIDCIQYRDEDHPHGTIQLTDLSLRGNALTTASMAKLAPVIALSETTLARLDISENEIRVTNNVQREEWESFLGSFHGCYMLKKIDFGQNRLGAAGFEVFARVYTQGELDFIVPAQRGHEPGSNGDEAGNGVVKAMSGLHLAKKTESLRLVNTTQGQQGTIHNDPAATARDNSHYASTRGLRSVPYLVFSGCCTTNACAFHLWNMIMCHRSPDQLLRFLPAGKSIALQDATADICGMAYKPDDGLEPLGQRLLELGVKYREKLAEPAAEYEEETLAYENEDSDDEKNLIKKRETERRAHVEMERVKNRLLLDIIKTNGMHSVDIWKVAFKMMTVARALLLVKETAKVGDNNSADNETPSPPPPPQEEERHFTPIATSAFAATAFTRFEDEFPSLEIYSQSAEREDNAKASKPTPRRGRNKEGSSSHSESTQRSHNNTQHSHITASDAVTKITASPLRAERKRLGLPMELWKEIIVSATEGSDILSEDQQVKVLQYASDWASIEQEMRINGGTEFEQQWKILSSMDCLSYQN